MTQNTLLYYALSYLPFLFLLWFSKSRQGLRLFDERGLASNLPMVIILHVGGILIFGIIPLLIDHPGRFMLINRDVFGGTSTWITILFFILSLIFTPLILSKKFRQIQFHTDVYSVPSISFFGAYFLLRILFIGIYECWFRGYLLADCISGFGVVWAVSINLILYAILHIANGKDEVLAGLPYGLLLCTLCICQRAVWPAIALHLALTIPYELGFLRKLKAKILMHHEHTRHRSFGLYRQ